MRRWRRRDALALIGGTTLALGALHSKRARAEMTLLNVSYDPTRELYKEFNDAFAEHWQQQIGEDVTIRMSHGGSGKQARAVIDGLEARRGDPGAGLRHRRDRRSAPAGCPRAGSRACPNNSAPYTSTIVFLVRKGNPKAIKDWGDLVKEGVQVITPNPKTSGGARWNYLAAWGWALRQQGGSEPKAQKFVAELYKHVPVLDTGARGATTTFVQRGIGDVLLAWENEAFLALEELGPDQFEIVVPPLSILAEPPVTLVDHVVDKHGTRKVAEAYLQYLYSPTGQRIAAKHYYRPVRPEDADPADRERFPKVELITVDDVFGGWQKAQKRHFADGGVFDQIATQ